MAELFSGLKKEILSLLLTVSLFPFAVRANDLSCRVLFTTPLSLSHVLHASYRGESEKNWPVQFSQLRSQFFWGASDYIFLYEFRFSVRIRVDTKRTPIQVMVRDWVENKELNREETLAFFLSLLRGLQERFHEKIDSSSPLMRLRLGNSVSQSARELLESQGLWIAGQQDVLFRVN